MTDVEQRIDRYYEGLDLTREQEERVRDAMSASAPDPRSRPQLATWSASLAAMLALGIALGVWMPRGQTDGDLGARRVSEEIKLNHEKQLAPEVAGTSYGALGAAMPKLDFAPVAPPDPGGYSVVGARYCSIGPAIAAQFKLESSDGRSATLYQFRGDAFPVIEDGSVYEVDGVRVTLWRQGDLVVGLAEGSP